ncbi:hypothetical protein N7G274_007413 [Stereocaulon virgatum]|uniref:Uncharacterized protein n=1 Tax=Stereocaulon virgatum TaxID=373712 RepID=A0ABR4A2A8_9LECA
MNHLGYFPYQLSRGPRQTFLHDKNSVALVFIKKKLLEKRSYHDGSVQRHHGNKKRSLCTIPANQNSQILKLHQGSIDETLQIWWRTASIGAYLYVFDNLNFNQAGASALRVESWSAIRYRYSLLCEKMSCSLVSVYPYLTARTESTK